MLTVLSIFSREKALIGVSNLLENQAPNNLIEVAKRRNQLEPLAPPGSNLIVSSREIIWFSTKEISYIFSKHLCKIRTNVIPNTTIFYFYFHAYKHKQSTQDIQASFQSMPDNIAADFQSQLDIEQEKNIQVLILE